MNYARLSQHSPPPRTRSVERRSEWVHGSIPLGWQPLFDPRARHENQHWDVLDPPILVFTLSFNPLQKTINPLY
jgi:hypothetical protein